MSDNIEICENESTKPKRRRKSKVATLPDSTVVSTKLIPEQVSIEADTAYVEPDAITDSNLDEESVINLEVIAEPYTTYKTGDVIQTTLALIYPSNVAPRHIGSIQGTYYIWDSEIISDRIRVTDTVDGCGDISRLIGWISITDIGR